MGLSAVLLATMFYWAGEIHNKWFKYLMGIPVALSFVWKTPEAMMCILTYFVACQLGYGDNNPMTKIFGKRAAIVIHGTAVGLASFPILGMYALIQGIVSGCAFYAIAEFDDAGQLHEPYIAIFRGLFGTCLLMGG